MHRTDPYLLPSLGQTCLSGLRWAPARPCQPSSDPPGPPSVTPPFSNIPSVPALWTESALARRHAMCVLTMSWTSGPGPEGQRLCSQGPGGGSKIRACQSERDAQTG